MHCYAFHTMHMLTMHNALYTMHMLIMHSHALHTMDMLTMHTTLLPIGGLAGLAFRIIYVYFWYIQCIYIN